MAKTRQVEYYRLWDSGTWDTDFIDVPEGTAENELDRAVREAARKISWRAGPPVIVGCYADTAEVEEEEAGNVPCAKCGRTDLPLHINGQCAECGPGGPEWEIHAECHSDDGLRTANFNAVRWFERASDAEIKELAQEDWGEDYAADRVAMFMAEFVPT
jgi:hypothetical protein